MSGFSDEGISFDDEDSGGLNGMPQYMADFAYPGSNGNINAMQPDVIMGDENAEMGYEMEIQDMYNGGRSLGVLEDYGQAEMGAFARGHFPQAVSREAEPQRSAVPELDFSVDSPAVDLDIHVGNHAGLMKTQRLIHVARHCPPLRVDALKMALKHVKDNSEDVSLYTKLHEDLKNAISSGLRGEDGDAVLPKFEETWVRETKKNHDAKMDKLENDLKNYKSNSIKESIRRGHDEIGYHFLSAGDATSALKAFNNSRDYAEGLKEQAHMLANRLKACVYLKSFPNAAQLQEQMRDVESGLSRMSAAAVKEARAKDIKEKESGVIAGPSAVVTDKNLEASWNLIKACMGLYYMSVGDYRKAADLFVTLNPESCHFNDVLVGRDIAVYGALCALARYDRKTLKEKVISNRGFKSFLETAPEVRRMVETFYNSQFGEFLKAFNEQRNALLLDLLCAPHVDRLISQTRTHGMIEFFRCYDSVSLADMAREFCYSPAVLQEELVKLILAGQLPARIDSINQSLVRDTPNLFMETAFKVKQHVDLLRDDLHMALLRSNLARHGLAVRGNRGEDSF